SSARALRARYGGAIVLKGATSVLIAADGEALNMLGTPAMAKGGSGDVLAGVLGALMAGREYYGLSGTRLLQTACALHGLAGMAAAEKYGERGALATDLCDELGRVPAAVPERRISLRTARMTEERKLTDFPANVGKGGTVAARATAAEEKLRLVLGKRVRVTVDRPLGSQHPDHKELVYGLNYGYVADVLAADNEWQDAYVFGVSEPVEIFEGEVVAIIHRLNDVEDKWVVAAAGTKPAAEAIRAQTAFAERYFESQIIL
ncbi:MAG: hypothetical protein LLF96_13825, partial [Eubacteriales bacterium]|nr:hypothetical protein [Eubacteriales bacterium]